MQIKYPVYTLSLTGNEKKYVLDCLDTSWISSRGSYIDLFEKAFAKYLQADRASAVSNGTVAMHLALLALGIKKGDEVIVPTLTYVASVNAIKYVDATPVFTDSLESTWQMNPEDIERKITPRTKAVIVVHLYGHPAEMSRIVEVCRKHNLFLVEDCAESIGSEYEQKKTGTFGDIAAFSFYGNKTITTGEGGMVVSNSQDLIDRVNLLKMQGVDPGKQYWHNIIGYNYRMTNICAAIGLAQLEKVEETIQKKLLIAKTYRACFDAAGISYHSTAAHVLNTYWMFSVLASSSSQRDPVRKQLLDNFGIETRPVFHPVHTMPMYSSHDNSDYPVAVDLGSRGINLPSYPGLSVEDVKFISQCVIDIIKTHAD
jgi:perosamine synthetase